MLERLDCRLVDVISALSRFIACQDVRQNDQLASDRRSAHRILQAKGVDSVAITSGETDVCVLATVPGAIDLGYEVKLLSDAVSSGVDETHDTTLRLLGGRFSVQVEFLTTDEFRTSR